MSDELTERTPLKLPRGTSATVDILAGNKRPLSQSQLVSAAGEAVRTAVAATCLWDADAWLGDYRYVVFNTSPKKHVDVFVQLWSEPGEPTLCEVCSGQFNNSTARWLPADLEDKLQRVGFSLPRRSEKRPGPQNYARHVTIRNRKEVASVAKTVLELFHDAFGYRGLTPIDVRVEYGSRAQERPVYSSFRPEDICKIASVLGYSADVVTSEGDEEATIELRKGSLRAEVILGDRVEGEKLYASGIVGSGRVPDRAKAGARHALKPYGLGRQPKVWRLGVMLNFEGGVTIDWVAGRIEHAMQLIARESRDEKRSRVRRLPAPRVH
jgi:hypothetical protein